MSCKCSFASARFEEARELHLLPRSGYSTDGILRTVTMLSVLRGKAETENEAESNPAIRMRIGRTRSLRGAGSDMELSTEFKGKEQEIIDLFAATFAASEGAEEGALIGDLARNLLATTADAEINVVTACEERSLVGAIICSRLTYDQDDRIVFLLGPVGVATDRQGEGIGQRLLACGLTALQKKGVDFAVTYGDPNYYSKVGFRPITEEFARAPFNLKYPKGWLGQSLADGKMTPLKGPSRCVEAFHRPDYW